MLAKVTVTMRAESPMIPMNFSAILPEVMDRLDPYVEVGPRGVHAHYITCLNRARTNGFATEEGAGVQPFRKLGELVLGNACPWVSRKPASHLLTPLMKQGAGYDARPLSAKDCDYAVWTRSIHRTVVDYVRKMVCPQQLGIGSHPVSSSKINRSDLVRRTSRIRQRRSPREG
jgi:hypothetical protein